MCQYCSSLLVYRTARLYISNTGRTYTGGSGSYIDPDPAHNTGIMKGVNVPILKFPAVISHCPSFYIQHWCYKHKVPDPLLLGIRPRNPVIMIGVVNVPILKFPAVISF